jgi:hypothetical protein
MRVAKGNHRLLSGEMELHLLLGGEAIHEGKRNRERF